MMPATSSSPAATSGNLSLTPQVRLGLGPSQLFDDRFDLRRITEQADASSHSAPRLQTERGLRLFVLRVGHYASNRVDGARALQQRLAIISIGRDATDDVIRAC